MQVTKSITMLAALVYLCVPLNAQRTAADLANAYNSAQELLRDGRYAEAERLMHAAILPPQLYQSGSVTAEQLPLFRLNSTLLALEADLIASGRSTLSRDRLDAEAYFAWAIYSWRCDPEYWHKYVDIRLRREGIETFLAAVRNRQARKYAFPGTSITIGAPAPDRVLEALLYRSQGDEARAQALLADEVRRSGSDGCPAKELLAAGSTRILATTSTAPRSDWSGPAGPNRPGGAPAAKAPAGPAYTPAALAAITTACTQVDQGNYKGARATLLAHSAAERTTADAFALFIMALLMTDATGAEQWFSNWRQLDPSRVSRCQHLRIPGVIQSLRTAAFKELAHNGLAGRGQVRRVPPSFGAASGGLCASKQRKRDTGQLLNGLAMEFYDDALARSAALSFNAKVLKGDPTTLSAVLDQTRQTKRQQQRTQQRMDGVERELTLHHSQLAQLNNDAKALLSRMGATEQRVSGVDSSIRLQERQLQALDARIDEVFAILNQRQDKLTRLIDQRHAQVMALVNSLRNELTKANEYAAQRRMEPIYPVNQVSTLDTGHVQPSRVAAGIIDISRTNSSHRISSALGSLSNMVTVGPPIGIFQINVLGILAKLVELLGY